MRRMRRMARRVFLVRRSGAHWFPVGDHAAAHCLVRVSVLRRIAGHGHRPVLHVPLRDNPSLCGLSSGLLVVLGVSEGVGRGLLLLLRRRRRLLVHLGSRVVGERLRPVWVCVHGRRRSPVLVPSWSVLMAWPILVARAVLV